MTRGDIEQVLELWKEATGDDPKLRKNKYRFGVSYDFTTNEALEYLEEDKTGFLSALKLRQAFKEFISQNQLTVEQLLDNAWDELKSSMIKLKDSLYSGVIGETYNTFIKGLIRNIRSLGKEFKEEDLNKVEKVEDILFKAVINFNKPYELKQERFTQGELKKIEPIIFKKLFRFKSFEDFVDNLKATKENNFICVALCDRTFNEQDGSDYDSSYDSHFAIGLKNNGVVYTISDRTVFDSPDGGARRRNPGREFFEKVDFSYLPYYKIESIEEATENTDKKLITFNTLEVDQDLNIVSLFDDQGIVYITTLLTLVYNKYFVNPEEVKDEVLFFGKNIKLLPQNTSKVLVVKDDKLELTNMSTDINYLSYEDIKDKTDKYGIYDWLLDVYPLPEEELKFPTRFIGTKEEAQRNLWWQIRNKQKQYITKCLEKDMRRRQEAIIKFFSKNFIKNSSDIVEFMLSNKPVDNLDNFNLAEGHNNKEYLPFVHELYKDGKDMELFRLWNREDPLSQKQIDHIIKRYDDPSEIIAGKCKFGYYNGRLVYNSKRPIIWFEDDCKNRTIEIILTFRTYSDIKKFFKLKELPTDLTRYINLRADAWSSYAWEPYSGNPILNFTDPMNEIEIPYNEYEFSASIYVSKTFYKKLLKEVNNG